MSGKPRAYYLLTALALACLLAGGCGPKAIEGKGDPRAATGLIEERLGVKVEGLRLVAAGYMVDFRYRVLDPEKAAPLQDKRERAYLIDEATGRAFVVPRPAKVGELRQAVFNSPPVVGKTYSIIFANPGRAMKKGATASIVIGGFRAEGLIIE
ncbi:MAG: hypothetical protein HY890_08550 [Deltaproteobacteria bacterium]|nr:hypothetical protein [Deltaproteobacteria bacterium]